MKYLLPIVTLFLLAVTSPALAEGLDDNIICAAVHPCNSDGTVYAPYNEGACAAKYARECASDLSNKITDQLVSCEGDKSNLATQLSSATKELSKLKRAYRRALKK